MTEFWDDVKHIINELEPLLLVIIPTCFGVYLKLKNKINAKKDEIERLDADKNKKEMKNWEHVESMNVIRDIKTICNYYKDIGHMDSVIYLQLENGTVATSRLSNMFITCLTEDSRASKIPKVSSSIQRVPYSRLIELVADAYNKIIVNCDFKSKDKSCSKHREIMDVVPSFESVSSYIIAPVRNMQGYLIGYCLFLYANPMSNGEDEKEHTDLMNKFVASVEAVFLRYNKARDKKKKELKVI